MYDYIYYLSYKAHCNYVLCILAINNIVAAYGEAHKKKINVPVKLNKRAVRSILDSGLHETGLQNTFHRKSNDHTTVKIFTDRRLMDVRRQKCIVCGSFLWPFAYVVIKLDLRWNLKK